MDQREFFAEATEANRYKLTEVIGKGSYGVVASAVDQFTGGCLSQLPGARCTHTITLGCPRSGCLDDGLERAAHSTCMAVSLPTSAGNMLGLMRLVGCATVPCQHGASAASRMA